MIGVFSLIFEKAKIGILFLRLILVCLELKLWEEKIEPNTYLDFRWLD
jgi:hypothetical protein